MQRIHTAAEVREIDAYAARTLKLPTALLMENAGRSVADAAREHTTAVNCWLVCGKGNNGGDGWVAARHLLGAFRVRVVSAVPVAELAGDARAAAEAAIACGVELVPELDRNLVVRGDLVIDAVLGTGVSRPAEGRALELIRAINELRRQPGGAFVLSVDLPSGLDADHHHPIGEHVRADATLALHALKPVHVQHPTRAACGELRLVSLGFPADLYVPGPRRTWHEFPVALPPRPADAHKGTSGHVLVVAGSAGKTGAATLVCRAAFRTGAGLVTLAAPTDVIDHVVGNTPEVMGFPLDPLTAEGLLAALDRKNALVIGPGIARPPGTGRLIVELLSHVAIPSLIDADALNALADDRDALAHLKGARIPPILTPHPAELARLLDTTTEEIQADRFAAAVRAAQSFGAHVVLKGACSVIAHPDGSLDVNSSGNPAMATGGTGDVLAGVCGSLLGQRVPPGDAAVAAAWVHGKAGDLAAHGSRGLLASDLVDRIPDALRAIS